VKVPIAAPYPSPTATAPTRMNCERREKRDGRGRSVAGRRPGVERDAWHPLAARSREVGTRRLGTCVTVPRALPMASIHAPCEATAKGHQMRFSRLADRGDISRGTPDEWDARFSDRHVPWLKSFCPHRVRPTWLRRLRCCAETVMACLGRSVSQAASQLAIQVLVATS
jgi:hypothetical protein